MVYDEKTKEFKPRYGYKRWNFPSPSNHCINQCILFASFMAPIAKKPNQYPHAAAIQI